MCLLCFRIFDLHGGVLQLGRIPSLLNLWVHLWGGSHALADWFLRLGFKSLWALQPVCCKRLQLHASSMALRTLRGGRVQGVCIKA